MTTMIFGFGVLAPLLVNLPVDGLTLSVAWWYVVAVCALLVVEGFRGDNTFNWSMVLPRASSVGNHWGPGGIYLSWGLYLLVCGWSAWSSADPLLAWETWASQAVGLVVFWFAATWGARQVTAGVRAFAYGALVMAVWALAGYFKWAHSFPAHGIHRQAALLGNPNTLGGYLIMAVPLSVMFIYQAAAKGNQVQRIFWWLVTTVLAAGLVVTYTRGSWLAAAIAVVFLAVVWDRRLFLWLVIYAVGLSLVFPGVGLRASTGIQLNHYGQPVVTGQSSNDRLQYWTVALVMLRDHPLTGIGLGQFPAQEATYVQRYPSLNRGAPPGRQPHNSFLKDAAEMGIPGIVSFLLVVISTAWYLFGRWWDRKKKRDNWGVTHELFPVQTALIAAAGAFLIQANTNSLFHIGRTDLAIWFLMGLAVASFFQDDLAAHKVP